MQQETILKGFSLPDFPVSFERAIVEGEVEMIYATGVDEATFRAYLDMLMVDGFALYVEDRLADNIFVTLTRGEISVLCSFDPVGGTVRAIPDAITVLPPRAEDNQLGDKFEETLLTQLRLNNLNNDCGMCYTFRLRDGRFLLFDGGCRDHEDHVKLYEQMKSQCAEGEEPVIAAWFLSHAHGDHYGNFFALMEHYGDRVKVEMMVYNLPHDSVLLTQTHADYEARMAEALATVNAPTVYARTGQRFHFSNAVVETLFAPDDFYPEKYKSSRENDFSVVFRVVSEGQSVMILGDTETNGSAALCKRFGTWLKSDIMQQAHHGFWAGSVELYEKIDPETVLWPAPFHWYYNLHDGNCNCDSNATIHHSKNVKEILLSSLATYVLSLPYHPAKKNRPQNIRFPYADGDVISNADFAGIAHLYELGWSYINTNGWNEKSFTFDVPSVVLDEKNGVRGARLTGNKYSVLNVVRPELLRGVECFTVDLKLDVEALGDGFSVWYNDENPASRSDRVLYTINRSGMLQLTLKVDRNAGTTEVLLDGAHFETLRNACNDDGGIQLLLRGCEVFLYGLSVTAGIVE